MGQNEAVTGISRDTRILKYYIFLYAFSSRMVVQGKKTKES